MSLCKIMVPNEYVANLKQIEPGSLKHQGIEAVICDVDNTLVPYGSEEIARDTLQWLCRLREQGLKMALVSNALSRRVSRVACRLDLPAVPRASKPRRRGYRRALDMLQAEPEQTAVIGDQLFTDVVGGNRLGMHTILVVPLSDQDFVGTRVVRFFERLTLHYLSWRGLTETP